MFADTEDQELRDRDPAFPETHSSIERVRELAPAASTFDAALWREAVADRNAVRYRHRGSAGREATTSTSANSSITNAT